MEQISVLSDENIKQLCRLKEVLEKHCYTTKTLEGLDTSNLSLPSTLYKLKEDTPQNTLIRLFFIGRIIREHEIGKLFTSEERRAFVKLGILEKVGCEKWRACIELFPYKNYILFCDFDPKDGKIEPIYQPEADSFNLEEAGISRSFNCALDLCTGSG